VIRRAILCSLAFVAAATADVAKGAALARVELCTDDAVAATGAVARLSRLMSTASVSSRGLPCDAPAPGSYLARFEARGAAVVVVLAGPGGGRLERKVPWLRDVERPLSRLEGNGHLVEFSLLLESLLAEDRAGPLPDLEPFPAAPGTVAAPVSIGRKTDGVKRRKPPASRRPPAVAAVPKPVEPPEEGTPSASTEPAGEGSNTEGDAALHGQGDTGGAAPNPGVAPTDLDGTAGAAGEAPVAPAAGSGADAAPRSPGVLSPSRPEAFESVPPAPDREHPWWSTWRLEVSAVGGLRTRSPGLSSPEAGLRLAFGPIWVRTALEGDAWWDLGTPIRISASSASAGAEVPLFGVGAWRASGTAGVGLDRLELQRTDFEEAEAWRLVDAGPLAGFLLGWESGPIASSLLVEAQWTPTARRIWLPEGTSGVLGRWSVRAGVTLGWKR